MPGQPHRFSRIAAVALLLGASLLPFVTSPAAAFGERVYDANTVVGATDPFLLVWSGQSVAQSFAATETYILLNVTLRLRNIAGTGNLLNVTIRPDAAGVPGVIVLAWSNVQGGGTVGPVSVPLTPSVNLTRGALYWIVAAKGGPSNQGYEWHHSGGNTYAGGKAMVNANAGAGWVNPASATDLWFLTYGRQIDANVTIRMTASVPQALPKDTVTFTLYVNNTGTQASPMVWVNDSLPAGLTFVTDTSGTTPAATGFPNYSFANVGNGPHPFTITAHVDVDVAPGTTLTNRASLTYANHTGVLITKPSSGASILIGLQPKQLYLLPVNPLAGTQGLTPTTPTGGAGSLVAYRIQRGGVGVGFLSSPLRRTFRLENATAILYLDSNSHGAKILDMNFTLVDQVGATPKPIGYDQLRVTTDNVAGYQRFVFPFPALDANVSAGHQILLVIRDMSTAQDDALLATNTTATPSLLDVLTTTYVRVDALDLRDANGPATIWSPMDALVIHANVSDPLGTREIAGAWANVTDPSGASVLTLAAMTLLASNASGWKLYGVSVAPLLANGTYRIEVLVEEGNGVLAYATGSALVRAPAFDLVLDPTQASALSGDTFFFLVWYNDTGSGPAARVGIDMALPSQLLFVTSSAEANRTGATAWSWTNVGVGNHSLVVEVRVRTNIPPVPSLTTWGWLNATDEKGYAWPTRSVSAGVVLQGPVLAFAFSVSKTAVHANESFVLTSTLHNGGDLAGLVWLNLSWSGGLAYVSDTSASIGGSSTTTGSGVDILATNLAPGATATVNVTVQTGPGLLRGLTLTMVARLNYTNANDAPMPPELASRAVSVIAPAVVNATLRFVPSGVVPGDILPGTITFANMGDESALSLVVTLNLDASLAVRNASVAPTVAGSTAFFNLADFGVGSGTIFMNLTVSPAAADREVLRAGGSIVYTDRLGNPEPLVPLPVASVTVTAPVFQLAASPADPAVEAGTQITYRIDPANVGTGSAAGVWLNTTLPQQFLYVSDSADGVRTAVGSQESWYWPSFGPGGRPFNLTLAIAADVGNGTTGTFIMTATYADPNGNLRAPANGTVRASFLAPTIQLSLAVSVDSVPMQTTFYYTLRAKNVGGTPAKTLWLLDAVDPGLKIFSYTSSVGAQGNQTLNWTYADLGPGEEEAITLFVQVQPGVATGTQIPNFITAGYTNSQGAVLRAVQSKAVVVTVAAPPSILPSLIVAVLLAAGFLLFFLARRRSARIEEVYLISRAGLVIDHLTRSLVEDKDPDIVGGMLAGVQDFAREAFQFGSDRALHEMEFGDKRILLVRGADVFLAAVVTGQDVHGLEAKLRKALAEIEVRFGPTLARFNGRVSEILDVREDLRHRLLR